MGIGQVPKAVAAEQSARLTETMHRGDSALTLRVESSTGGEILAAYLELVKPRLTMLILLVAAAGFWLASPSVFDAPLFRDTIVAIALLAGGIFALNQYLERDLDALMRRTECRPLPTGRLSSAAALMFGLVSSASAFAILAVRVNTLTAALGLFTFAAYILVYTPLKTRTPHCTLLGAVPGAMPPVIGWAAVTGELGAEAAALFMILFFWQFPHFHSISWLYRDDYARAGIRMWPVVEPGGKTMGREITAYSVLLVPASAAPALLGVTGGTYLAAAVVLGLGMLFLALRMVRRRTRWHARRLLIASVTYLPVLFVLMVLDR